MVRSARPEIMLTIDAQVHAYERNHPARPWLAVLPGPEEVTGDDMVAAMDAVGVDGALLVSPFTLYGYDASYILEVHAAHPGRFGLIKPVDPNDPAVADTIAEWAAIDGAVAVRLMLNRGASEDPDDPGLNRVLAAAARHSLPVNLLCWGRLEQAGALAVHDNIAVKITGACTLSHEPFPYKDLWDPLFRIFEAFGFDRCMWGTDWTRAVALLTYRQGVEAFHAIDRLSDGERAALMGGTLTRVYNWSPTTA